MRSGADLIVLHASLWSGAVRRDADALAVSEGRVLCTGRVDEVAALHGPGTRVLDAHGATVTPGLVDAHIHLVAWARSLSELDLEGCGTRGEVAVRVAAQLARHPGDGPIVGRGWDANGWPEPPHRSALDAVAPARAVLLHSRDFHSLWVNTAALRLAGVGRETADFEGGRIERDPMGEPTGVLREHAVRLLAGLDPSASESVSPGVGSDPVPAEVRSAIERLHAFGITAVHDFEGAPAHRILRALASGPHPRIRVLMHLPHAALEAALTIGLTSGTGDESFRIGAIKLFADGTLGSRTAAMLAPFDGTAERGMDLMSAAELRETVGRAVRGGLSVAVHAIGDRAVRSTLDAFEAVGERLRSLALPPRIEHAQLVDPADLARFARLGVAASMQPIHCTSDMDLARRYWGDRCDGAYPWRGLLESGALLAFGSDAPVESPSVALGLHAAVTRERADRAGAFVPGQRVGLDQALAAYTEGPARLAGEWPRAGNLRAGAVADLVIWNADLHRLAPAELCRAAPAVTVLGGEVVYVAAEPRVGSGPRLDVADVVRQEGGR